MKNLVAVVSMVALVGCSGSANGTVGGVSLNVADAIFSVLKEDGKSIGAIVILADKPNICTSLKANREPKTATSIVFTLFRFSDTDYLAPDAVDYTVTDSVPTTAGNHSFAQFSRTDSNCTNTVAAATAQGKSGLVKVSALKGEANGTASGTFDVTFGAGDKVTGNFNASFCDISSLPQNPNCE